jgi:glycerophosphoryl diester phosphodiesterase
MKRLLLAGWKTLRENWMLLGVYYLVFQAIALLILVPLGNWIVTRLIATSGRMALGNEHLAAFLVSPTGVITVVIFCTIFLALEFAQYTGLVWIAGGGIHGREISAVGALRETLKKSRPVLELGLLQIVAHLIAALPFLAAGGLLYFLLTQDRDINYLVTVRPPIFWVGALAAGLIAVGGLLVVLMLRVRWIYSIPICMFEEQSAFASMRLSRKEAKGSFWRLASLFLGWWAAIFVASLLCLGILYLLGSFVLGMFGGSLHLLIAIVGALVLLNILTIVVFTSLFWAGNTILAVELYRDLRGLPHGEIARPSRKSRLRHVFAAVVLLALAGVLTQAMSEILAVERPVAITAHRGASADAPENTLAALRKSIEDGADFAEIDVQEIADGRIVLTHDTDLLRIAGVKRKIWEVTYEEIRTLDAGAWFSPEFKGERFPLLEEAIDLSRGRLKLNIELKFNGHERKLVESVVRIIAEKDFESECVISSLNYEALVEAGKLSPKLKRGYIVFEAVGNLSRLEVDFLAVRDKLATRDLIRSAHRSDMQVHVWTVNREANLVTFIDLGVDNILTDHPALARRVRADREALSRQEKILLTFRNWWWR